MSSTIDPPQPTLPLSTGLHIPSLGFGTYDPSPKKAYDATLHALRSGWRHLDTAHGYHNEIEVGRAVREFLKENGGMFTREDIFVTSKLPNHLHEPEDVEWAIEDSLRMLRMEYVDLYLVHWPLAFEKKEDRSGSKQGPDGKSILNRELTANPKPTWQAMEKIHSEGKARAIGVSNFTIAGLEAMKAYANIIPACNQCEVHPYLPNEALLQYCKANSIILAAYSPLGGQGNSDPLFTHPKMQALAEKKGATIAQMLIAWGLRRGYVVLPKSFTPSRIESNFQLVELSDEEAREVDEVTGGERKRFCDIKGVGWDIWADSE